MLFFVVCSVLSFLNLGTEAVQKEEIPKFYREIERKQEISKYSDTTPLRNKFISELKDMKDQILHETPEQLEKLGLEVKKIANDLENVKGMIKANADKTGNLITEQLAKQEERIEKMANDFENVKGMIEAQANISGVMKEIDAKQTEEIKNIAKDIGEIKNCCTKQADESKNNQVHLKRIETSVDNVTIRAGQISESLQVHDQRLQDFSKRDFCIPPRHCSDIRRAGYRSNGVYRIYLNNNTPKDVYCDLNTPGGDWLVFQRRRDGSVSFYQNWNSYTNGFGNVNGEFWLGNEILFQLTSNRKYKLRIDLEDYENQKRFAEYSTFSVGPSSDYYRLKIGTYSGNSGDSLSYHNNQQFSTYDVDRDQYESNCASQFHGAWWYHSCHYSNLNGRYYSSSAVSSDGICWYHRLNSYQTLKTTEMKIAFFN